MNSSTEIAVEVYIGLAIPTKDQLASVLVSMSQACVCHVRRDSFWFVLVPLEIQRETKRTTRIRFGFFPLQKVEVGPMEHPSFPNQIAIKLGGFKCCFAATPPLPSPHFLTAQVS